MKAPVRVDYAAEGHGTWLSLERSFPTVETAVKEAQLRLERWEPCIGFRIVEAAHPLFEKMTEEHVGKIIDLAGQKMIPWEVS